MKILHTVEFYSPSVGGAQEVVKQISERLAKRGHDVTVATTYLSERVDSEINGVRIKEFEISGNAVSGFSGDVENYKRFLIDSKFDIVMNYAAQQWATDLMLPMLKNISAKKVLVPCGFSGLYLEKYRDYYEKMKTWARQYDACVYLSNNYRDIDFARTFGINNSVLIPNGAGQDEFAEMPSLDIRSILKIPKDHFLILHVGSHTGLKGHKEAIEIFKKVNIRHTSLLIIGNDFRKGCGAMCGRAETFHRWNPLSKIMDKRIIMGRSLSREETIAAYRAADLFLFPSNIECSPLVLFECMASETPFLTTDVGNAAEIIKWSGAGLLLPTIKDKNGYSHAVIDESVKMLANIYAEPGIRKEMQSSGLKSWGEKFTWEIITTKYEYLYTNLLSGSPLMKWGTLRELSPKI
jgi:L-malate glycosyltransferase